MALGLRSMNEIEITVQSSWSSSGKKWWCLHEDENRRDEQEGTSWYNLLLWVGAQNSNIKLSFDSSI